MAKASEVTWEGAKPLRRHLRPVPELDTFPGNPRRGDVERIAESLRRFGQVRPILVDQRGRIVAGNHTFKAAVSLGWSHVAAIEAELDEEEALAYLVADNRTADLATWDDEALEPILKRLHETGKLEGTGYTPEEAEAALWEMEALAARAREDATPPAGFREIDPDALPTEHRCPSCGYEWSGSPSPGG